MWHFFYNLVSSVTYFPVIVCDGDYSSVNKAFIKNDLYRSTTGLWYGMGRNNAVTRNADRAFLITTAVKVSKWGHF